MYTKYPLKTYLKKRCIISAPHEHHITFLSRKGKRLAALQETMQSGRKQTFHNQKGKTLVQGS